MKLKQLKEQVYSSWQYLHLVDGVYVDRAGTPTTNAAFKAEIRTYGDLRKKVTWEKAFASLQAKFLYNTNGDSAQMVRLNFIKAPKEKGYYELLPQLVEQFMMMPDGLECLIDGVKELASYRVPVAGYSTSDRDLVELFDAIQEAGRRLGRAVEFGPEPTPIRAA